jgi:RNA polymerase sigma-70 factor (ECF subfamily)
LHHPSDRAAPADERTAAPPDIAALTRRMAEGDEAAYRTFYDAYFHCLERYLLVVAAGDEEAAREALQATLVRVVRHIKPFPDEAAFWRWLTVLARSAFTDESRTRRRFLAFLDRFTRHVEVERGDPGEADERLLVLLQRGLAELPDEERRLVEEKYFEQRRVRELAGARQATEKAIESRLVRIRRKLRDAILKALKDESQP